MEAKASSFDVLGGGDPPSLAYKTSALWLSY